MEGAGPGPGPVKDHAYYVTRAAVGGGPFRNAKFSFRL